MPGADDGYYDGDKVYDCNDVYDGDGDGVDDDGDDGTS